MDDLLRTQIKDSCRLALPEGLKDLMSDISREVLRAQPQNLYQFIADYLSVLLVTREHLFIAAHVCDDLCKNRCCEELGDELRALSLNEEDVEKCLDIIGRYFSSDQVKEGNLLQNLARKTDIRQGDFPAIQEAVRRAFLRHQVNNTASIESSSTDCELDETALAAKHTLKIYKKATENQNRNYDCVAAKIQAAYRAYNVRREHRGRKVWYSRKEDASEKVHFQVKLQQRMADFVHTNKCASQCSSESLAGSFLSLPLYKPYSIGHPSDIVEADEVGEKEKERANFDYVTNRLNDDHRGTRFHEPKSKGKKRISFHNLVEVEPVENDSEVSDEVDEAGYESDEVGEDVIQEYSVDEETRDDTFKEHLTGNGDGTATPETTVLMEMKGDTELSLSEDDDKVEQNEMARITQRWFDNEAEINRDENRKEAEVVSPAEDDGRPIGAERKLIARIDNDVQSDDVSDDLNIFSL